MKDITLLKNELENRFAQTYCKVRDVTLCPNGKECTCSIAAETCAYLRTVIPEPYYRYSIFDFDGQSDNDNEELIDSKTALAAKEKILEYCWEGVSLESLVKISPEQLDKHSIIKRRRVNGNNVVIHANSYSYTEKKHMTRQKGKTFCASIIMKEAIKSRTFGGVDYVQMFDWIEYPILENLIRQKEEGILADIRSADWLVVDDIPNSNRTYSKQIVESFFLERLSDGLPTIFVFRFDVERVSGDDVLGIAITKILSDSKTCIISLSHKND
jgi:hypothetical protein